MRWYGFLRAIDAEAKTESPETTIVDGIGIVTYPMAAMGKTARKLSVSVEGSTLVHTPRDRLPEQLSILAGYDDLQAALAEADSAA
jgi:hypothetical protein